MREITSTVSSKGQVTIPAEIRKHLDIKEGDKLSFVIEDDGSVRVIAPHYRRIVELRGIAGSLDKARSWEEIRQIAREDHILEISGGE